MIEWYLPILQGKENDSILQTYHIQEPLLPWQQCNYRNYRGQELERIKTEGTQNINPKSKHNLPMVLNVSREAMSCLIGGWETKICWSSFKLKRN